MSSFTESCKASSGQLTEATIQRHSQLVALQENFFQFYEEDFLLSKSKPVRKRGTCDRGADINHLCDKLLKNNSFEQIPGRKIPGFNTLQHSTQIKNPRQFKEKMMKVLNEIADHREFPYGN